MFPGLSVPAVEMTLPPDTASPSRARRLVEMALSHDPADLVEIVTLLVSEAVTNAVLHAGTEVRVRIGREGESVRVEVADTSSAELQVRHPSEDAATGRGLLLIEELSDSWGLKRSDDGKVVWFELNPAGAAA